MLAVCQTDRLRLSRVVVRDKPAFVGAGAGDNAVFSGGLIAFLNRWSPSGNCRFDIMLA